MSVTPGSVRDVAIALENVGIAVDDLDAAIAFFTDLGLTVLGRDEVSGESVSYTHLTLPTIYSV